MSALLEVTHQRLSFNPHFIEGSYDPTTRTVAVNIISEGIGNSRDKNYYEAATLVDAVASQVFEGAQAYADHPSRFDEANRPERSVRDLIGYYFNTHMTTSVDKRTGKSVPTIGATFKIQEGADWVEGLIQEAIDYQSKFPNKVYAGISINADGDSVPGTQDGEKVNLVKKITEVFSADTVTKPARGGGFLKFVEGANGALSTKETRSMTQLEVADALTKLAEGEAVDPKTLLALAGNLKEAAAPMCANGACGHAKGSHDSDGCNAQECECSAFKAPKSEAKTEGEDTEGKKEADGTKEAQTTETKKETKTTEADVTAGSLYQMALREATAAVSADKDADIVSLRKQLSEATARINIRESMDLAKTILKESAIPVGGHAKVLSDIVGLSEAEMRSRVKAEEAYVESLGIATGKQVAGAGATTVPIRESEVTKQTNILCEGMEG